MYNLDLSDTIVAISTSIGESGIGIVRLSGKEAFSIADKIFVSKDNKKPSAFKTYTIHYGWIVRQATKQRKIIDEVILTVMRKPKSYTKEDIVEINCHGGILAVRAVLELVLESGARLAEPGEFTKRAFLNGRIDLAQAEAVLDTIRAKTDSALKIGVEQLRGVLSDKVNNLRNALLEIIAALEADIDFPEEEAGLVNPVKNNQIQIQEQEISNGINLKEILERLNRLNNELKDIIEAARYGRIIREGLHVVICGRPNVGKSSLLNALLRKERSIVTPIPGTTRDTIEEIIDIKGIPIRIVDTAGILEPRDLIEKHAVERSKKQIDLADLVILLFDGSRRLSKDDTALIAKLKKKVVIAIINKIDLKQKIKKENIEKKLNHVV
ncbi:MAG: tRNA uridine-5-carboxymethylaminomethyl(34) synthesis GTPase MnmE, partial [Candidatus Omnitrophota bacterium]|nr:tRNA uridine-5-carboxymethylaminomethyl(34) synthesis GTPase MnmE [Candidatus Omnitrophota bacterium]